MIGKMARYFTGSNVERAAIVTGVQEDGTVDLFVIPPNVRRVKTTGGPGGCLIDPDKPTKAKKDPT